MSNLTEPAKPSVALEVGSGPYKFLDYYAEDDKARFAGRDRDIQELVARVMTDRVCVLYGRSGLGKTSLLLAGVFPELQVRGLQPVYVRVLESPLQDACSALAAAFNLDPTTRPHQLLEKLNAITPAPRIVLVLDQFEEFFVRFRKQAADRRAFSTWLACMCGASTLDFRALISLREEYLSRLDEFSDDLPDLFGNEYRLRPLTAFGARQAIIRPLLEAGIKYDQRLVNRVVDLLAAQEFDSLLLQIVCSAIYREAAVRGEGHMALRERDLEGVGGLEGILRRYLDAATQTVDRGHLLLCRTILDALITPEATKRAVTLETLLQADFTATKEEAEGLLRSLERWRLVRREMRGGQVWYELTHERLVRHILDWFKLDRTFVDFRVARDLIAVSSRGEMFRERPETLLVPGQIEDVIGPFRERLRLDPVQAEFMFWSAVYRRTPSVGHWAKVLGYDKSREALLCLLKHKDATARGGAAAAAKEIPDSNGELAKQCLHVALYDQSESVRRSAGQSLAVLAGPEQLEALKTATTESMTRVSAREVLADIRLSGRGLGGFSFLTRLRAGRLAERRLLKQHSGTIRTRARIGLLSGLLAGLAWICSVGFLLTVMMGWLTGGIPLWGQIPSVPYLTDWGISIPVILLLASLAGWKAAKRAARREALKGEDRSLYSLGPTRTASLILIVCSGAVLVAIPIWKKGGIANSGSWPSFGVFLIWVALLPLAVTGLVFMSRHCVWPKVAQAQIWTWGLLQSLGFPLLIPGVITLALSKNVQPRYGLAETTLESVQIYGVLGGAVLSLTSCVLLVALARASLRVPLGKGNPENPRLRVLSRAVALAGVLGFVCWFIFSFGATSIPFMAQTIIPVRTSSNPGQAIATAQVKTSWPNSRYLRLQAEGDGGQWFRVLAAPSSAKLHFRAGDSEQDLALSPDSYSYGGKNLDVFLFVPSGELLASLSIDHPVSSEGQTLKLETVQDYANSLPLDLARPSPYWYVTFMRDSSGAFWSAEFSGSLQQGTVTTGKAIRMSFLPQIPSGINPSSEGSISAQAAEHGNCTLRSTAPFELPLSVAGFSFAVKSGEIRALSPSYAVPVRDGNWLEIPVDDKGSFHTRFQFTPNKMESGPPALTDARQVFRRKTSGAGLPSSSFTVAAALQLVDTPWTINNEITDFLKRGKFSEAIAEARKVSQSWPYDDCSRNNLAWGLVKTGQFKEALQVALKAAQLNPNSPQIQDTLAHAAYGVKDWKRAEQAWENAERLDPDFFAHLDDPACVEDKKLYDLAKGRAQ